MYYFNRKAILISNCLPGGQMETAEANVPVRV